jgi:hypothetical protein
MPRLPQPGSDAGNWGNVLNDFLSTTHDTNGQLKAGSVSNVSIAAGAVTLAKLAINNAPTSGQALTFDGSGLSWSTITGSGTVPDASTTTKGLVQLGGDLAGTSAAPTVPGLAAKANSSDVVTLAGAQTVTGAKNFTGGLQSAGVALVNTTDARLTNTRTPSDASVTTAKLADDSVTEPKLAVSNTPSTGQVLSYNGTGLAWAAAATGGTGGGDPILGGDLSGTASAAVINAGVVGTNELSDNAVTAAKILNANVTTAKIADANVTTAKVADGSITEPKLAVSNSPAANQVLSYNGTQLAWTTPAAGGATGSTWNAVATSTDYDSASGDFVIGNTTAGGLRVNLPAAANGAYVTIKKLTNDVNAILVYPPSGQINAGSGTSNTISVNSYGMVADFIADGTTWHQVG